MTTTEETTPSLTINDSLDAWTRLWFALSDKPWRVLALVPADEPSAPGAPSLACEAAKSLARVAASFGGRSVVVLDATHAAPADVERVLKGCADRARAGARILVAVAAPSHKPAAIPLARGADAALLCVGLGRDALASAAEAVAQVGPSRFVGSVAIEGMGR